MEKTYYAPASIGNFSVGFDTLGLALSPVNGELLGDRLAIATAAKHSTKSKLVVAGRYRHQLPTKSQDNLVLRCWTAFRRLVAKPLPELNFTLQKELPVGSGLGSSACSVVVTCYGLNHFFAEPLTTMELLNLMAEIEGGVSGSVHLDNVAPAFLGGMQLMTPSLDEPALKLPWFSHWSVVVSYPGTVINTAMARQVLPATIALPTTVRAAKNLASFVSGLYTENEALALNALEDTIAEPYRQPLIPKLASLREQAHRLGIHHLGISGAGPTLFALCTDDEQARQAQQLFENHYHTNADAMTHHCRVDLSGARLLVSEEAPNAIS
ncbi:MAG: homoserine kinase [Idiomarina sp.]|uniref:Homoserine kinase n=1 Tax=Idiomarina aquatica TaxID=1327752 RepID=A0A4R6P3R4_9GAMM|nr:MULTISPECIES: homoserine kinase [Idiomarina]MBL4741881.1 homoserine kinase [Idiomarina sp.]MBT41414.1 homoserine kinase [Idiomarina sp.]PHQ77506.1 MAG: homoserine kinase [Idiomarina sp.]TDP32207.1 homoserine kinase [Idiomarina aquatica]